MRMPEHDLFHKGDQNPYWNESSWMAILAPERNLSGWLYVQHRPNMKLTSAGFALWDLSGERAEECAFYYVNPHIPLPDGAEMYEFQLDTGLVMHTAELQQSYEMTYADAHLKADLRWDAILDPQFAGWDPAHAEMMKTAAAGHFDQPGRMTGTLDIDGERIDIDCLSMRDHSWGARSYGVWPRVNFSWANAGPESSFLICTIAGQPEVDDPVLGTTEGLLFGYFARDGESAPVTACEYTTERDADSRPRSVVMTGSDKLGRDFRAEADIRNWFRFMHYGNQALWWCLARWNIDGVEAWGEHQDMLSFAKNRELVLRAAAHGGHPLKLE